ncbi:TlpA disulfide reductase family protein [Actinospongicola halichondriae]|uniref:TlpA disulfide reductase family protein n=1 Tax=Actinospongicola halichondriae TaxID=3236844 RepID=UPI003D47FA4D
MSTSRTTPSRPSNGPDPKVIGGVVVGVLVLLVASIVFVTSGGDDADTASVDPKLEYGIITAKGDRLPTMPEVGDDPAVGLVAPSVVSERSVGQVRLEPGVDDQPTMVVFLAHWCPHCQAELPLLVQMDADGAFDGVRSVAVLTNTTEARPNFPPSSWLDDEGWTGDRLFDDAEASAASAYGLASFPMMVFLDAEGTVVERLTGEQPADAIAAAVAAITA